MDTIGHLPVTAYWFIRSHRRRSFERLAADVEVMDDEVGAMPGRLDDGGVGTVDTLDPLRPAPHAIGALGASNEPGGANAFGSVR